MPNSVYKTQELIDQKVDFSVIFPEKQKVVKEMTGFDFSFPEIVSFLRTTTDNFTKENPIALDIDREIYATYLVYKEKSGEPKPAPPTPAPASPEEKIAKLEGRLGILEKMKAKASGDKEKAISGRIEIIRKMLAKAKESKAPAPAPAEPKKAEPKKSEPKAEPKGGLTADQIESLRRTIKAGKSEVGVKIAKRKLEAAGVSIE
jgi:hypothetical protein